MEFLQGFQKFILIYRHDKILQAISELLAEEARIWGSEDEESQYSLGRSFQEPDIMAITRKMNRQIREEHAWRAILRDMQVDFHAVRYEDLENSPHHEFKRVNEYLGIAGMSSVHLKPRTIKLTDPSAALKMKQDYLHAIGGC